MSLCPRTRPKPTASKLKSAVRTLNLWMATSQTQGAFQRNAQRNLGCLMYPPCASLTAWRARRRWATRLPSRWGGPSPMSSYIPPVVALALSACGKRLAKWRQWAGLTASAPRCSPCSRRAAPQSYAPSTKAQNSPSRGRTRTRLQQASVFPPRLATT